LRIRPYAAADLDALMALFRTSVRSLAPRDYTLGQVVAWAPDEIDPDGWRLGLAASSTWVATSGDRPAGFISLEWDGRLDMLYVDPEFQGRGVATMLLRQLEASAEARGLVRLFTESSVAAKPFFERRGFRAIVAQVVSRRGQGLANFRMERRLA
jgi:putative acetyltransferase